MSTNQPDLPARLETERALFGCLMLERIPMTAARILRPDDFSCEAHAAIFATLCQLEADGLPVQLPFLTTRLERSGQLERVGGASYLASFTLAAPATPTIPPYINRVRQAARAALPDSVFADAPPPPVPDPSPPGAARDGGATGVRPTGSAGVPAGGGWGSGASASAALRENLSGSEAHAASPSHRAPEPLEDISPEVARGQLAALAPNLQPIQTLLSYDFAPTRWIIPDLLPEGLTLLASKPKLGKSWLALGLALAVASGGVVLGKIAVEPGAALYLALEDSEKRLHARTRQLLQGAPLTGSLDVTTHWPRLDQGGLIHLKLWLQGHPNARLIILDTLAKIRGHGRGSASLYGSDYASLEGVQALAHHYQVAILVIHHTGKASRADPLDEVNATQGLNGVVDNILVLRRQRGKAEAMLVGDGRELNGVELYLRFDPITCAWSITEPLAPEASTPERTEILQLLKTSQEPMTPTQVAEVVGKTPNATRKLLARMVHDGSIQAASYGKYASIRIQEASTAGKAN